MNNRKLKADEKLLLGLTVKQPVRPMLEEDNTNLTAQTKVRHRCNCKWHHSREYPRDKETNQILERVSLLPTGRSSAKVRSKGLLPGLRRRRIDTRL